MPTATIDRSELTVDRLPDPTAPLVVIRLDGMDVGGDDGVAVREPHRHDYHELIWVRDGTGRHLLDGEALPIQPRTLTLIGRGQVHVFEQARAVHGAVVRFGEDMVHGGGDERGAPRWLLAGQGGRTVEVPAEEVEVLDATIAALGAETERQADACSSDVERHLLSVLLLWIERWYDAGRATRRTAEEAEEQLHRRFADLLERDFARHHDARHYADSLGVAPAALSRALAQVTGRSTKELVTDRAMLEAARLLRFTDLSVGEVAYHAGFTDPVYFSRAFKRHAGEAPTAYRARARGSG